MNELEFEQLVTQELGNFLSSNAFTKSHTSQDEDHLAIYFNSSQAKLVVIKDDQNGEVNAMIGTPSAIDFIHQDDPLSPTWRYYRSFDESLNELSFEELLKQVPDSAKTPKEELCEVAQFLSLNWNYILAKI